MRFDQQDFFKYEHLSTVSHCCKHGSESQEQNRQKSLFSFSRVKTVNKRINR